MKTTIEYKRDEADTVVDDVMPSLNADDSTVTLIDSESNCVSDEIPLAEVKRVVFDND